MKYRCLLFILIIAAAAIMAASQTTIRVKTEEVRVDLLATKNRKPVFGLSPEDFKVFDNGVRQKIEYLKYEEIPIDVVLALDMSESVAGEKLTHLKNAGKALIGGLKKEDHAALITFSHEVNLGIKLTNDFESIKSLLEAAAPLGETSVMDASYAGLVMSESGEGRPLLIVFSDGLDVASWLTSAAILDAAKRGHMVVYAVSTGRLPKESFLKDLCKFTGGDLLEVESTKYLDAVFLKILDEFRKRYLLTYIPQGVERLGWHKIEVRVKRGGVKVNARPGYLRGTRTNARSSSKIQSKKQ